MRNWQRSGAAAFLLALTPGLAPAQEAGVVWHPGELPELRSVDGGFTLGPTGRLNYDFGGFFGQSEGEDPVGPRARGSLRRALVGVSGRIFHDFRYSFVWNFAGFQDDLGSLDTLSLDYRGLEPLSFTFGVFKPRFTLEDSQSSGDTLFMERAAVVNAASSIAAGSARFGGGVEASGRQYFGAAYLTGGRADVREDGRQRGAVIRLAGAPLYDEGGRRALHLGVSASWVLRPDLSSGGNEVVELSERPELRVESESLLGTGNLLSGRARSTGVELGGSWDRLWVQGEFHRVEVDRRDDGRVALFDGWYAQAAWLLLGEPRRWRGSRGAWDGPEPEEDFAPSRGQWGAVELGLRYSRLDLNDGGVRGGRQGIWTAGVSWYPTEDLRVTAQYQDGRATPEGEREAEAIRFQAAAIRLQLSF